MMKRSNFLALFAGLLLFRLLPAQTNLLLNAGFEEALHDQPKSWYSLGTVDFYRNKNVRKDGAAANTGPEYPEPQEGKNYIGIRSFGDATEVTAGRLEKPLEKDRWYKIQGYVYRPGADCNTPTAAISVVLSDSIAKTTVWYGYNKKIPSLALATADSRPTTEFAWTKVFGWYRARGGERFLWLGDFAGVTGIAPPSKSGVGMACVFHFYYDAFSVSPSIDPQSTLLTVRDITFDAGSTVITRVDDPQMTALIELLEDYPSYRLEVTGHTDSDGADAFNMELSAKRSEAVKSWLSARGVDVARIIAKGMGETQALVSNDSPEHKAMNRRVEIKILR